MSIVIMQRRRALDEMAPLVGIALVVGEAKAAEANKVGATVRPVLANALPNVPGGSLAAVVVTYGPGGTSPKHYHSGSAFGYVLSGAIRSQVSGQGPVKVYKIGEAFFEPTGSEHLVSENAGTTEPASLLTVFVADIGSQLTTFG